MSPVKEFFMVSPCGYKHGEFTAMNAPAGWTDCSDLSDGEIEQLIVRRSEATYQERCEEEAADRHDMMHADRNYEGWGS